MALYSEKVMDHFQNPRNVGKMEDASGIGEVGNAKCGDIMRIYIKVDPDTNIISDVKFNTFGCGSAIATSSMATEMIKGNSPTARLWKRWTVCLPQKSIVPCWQRRPCVPRYGTITTKTELPTDRN